MNRQPWNFQVAGQLHPRTVTRWCRVQQVLELRHNRDGWEQTRSPSSPTPVLNWTHNDSFVTYLLLGTAFQCQQRRHMRIKHQITELWNNVSEIPHCQSNCTITKYEHANFQRSIQAGSPEGRFAILRNTMWWNNLRTITMLICGRVEQYQTDITTTWVRFLWEPLFYMLFLERQHKKNFIFATKGMEKIKKMLLVYIPKRSGRTRLNDLLRANN